MIALITWIILHLVVLCLMLLTAAGAGQVCLRKYEFDSAVERVVFVVATGFGVIAFLVFGLGLAGLFYGGLLLLLTLAGAAASLAWFVKSWDGWRDLRGWLKWPRLTPQRAGAGLLRLGSFMFWGLLLWSALYPPVHWDAVSHHLVLCREYLAAHRLVVVWGIPWPTLPAFNHMLFTWGMALQDDITAQLVEHTFLMLVALGLYSWGKREKRALLGMAAAAFWLGSPLVLWLGESAYVDICLTAYIFLGIYALRLFWQRREAKWWILGMALLGLSAGAKVSGLFFVLIGGALGLWVWGEAIVKGWLNARRTPDASRPAEGPPSLSWKLLVAGWFAAVLALAPWYIYFTYYTGNPVWPTFSQYSRGVWGAPAVAEVMNHWYKNAAEPRTLVNFLRLPWDWVREPSRFYAEVNLTMFPLVVAWPLAWLVALWNRSVRWWTFWALSFTFYWFMFAHQLRYWLPVLPFAVLALYESISWALDKLPRAAVLHTVVWITLAIAAMGWGGRNLYGEVKAKGRPPIDDARRDAFMARVGGYRAVKYINQRAGDNDAVCVVNGSWLNYYLKPPVLDLHGPLQAGQFPHFRWPDDRDYMQRLEAQNINWIFLQFSDAPAYLQIPKRNIITDPFWPDFQLVYADSMTWVFRRKPVPPDTLTGLPAGVGPHH